MSATSSIVTALGGGSGIDMTALAENLAVAQFQTRNARLTQRGEQIERQISAAGSLKNALSQLSSAVGDRVRNGDLAVVPQVANPSVASAVSIAGVAGRGSYSLEVTKLASSQILTSPAVAESTAILGAGSLTVRFGSATPTGFTADGDKAPLTIDLTGGATLADVADAINRKNAGISAYVAKSTQGYQLVLKGSEGTLNGFSVEATETVGQEGLSLLAWNPANGGDPTRLAATSSDASFKLDGLTMACASNDTGQIAPGLSLKLAGTNVGAPTQIGFSSPVSAISSMMGDLVAALNEIAGQLNEATSYTSGDLANDPGARALKGQLSQLSGSVVIPNAAEGSVRTLADLGLALERDGTFRLDTARLSTSLARDPSGAAAMFTTGLYGVYATLDKLSRSASRAGDPGSLAGSLTRLQKQSSKISDDTSKLAEQQERLRSSLVARFAKADSRVTSSKSTLSFLQAQIAAWNSQKS